LRAGPIAAPAPQDGSSPAKPGAGRALPIAAILGVALALRLAHWAAVRQAPFIGAPAMDSWEYDRWAREIAGGDWLGHGRGVFFQAPLYPYLLALLYKAVGPRLDAAYLAQIGLAVAGCYALYRAGRAMAGERAGLAAAALAAVYGPFLFYDVQLVKESIAVTVVCFLLWAMAWALGAGRAGRWLLVGLLLGILALLRENALLVVPFLLPLASSGGRREAGAGPSRRTALAARAGRAAALLAGVALALGPVALRNGLVQ